MKGGREDVKVGERKDSKRETERKGNMERRVRERMITGPVVMCRVHQHFHSGWALSLVGNDDHGDMDV